MAPIISFDWTTPALMAGFKTCTRRLWKPRHAARFHQDQLCQGWDHQPRTGKGSLMTWIRLTQAPYWEAMADMPDSDYQAEGFEYLSQHPELVRANCPIDPSWEGFQRWRDSGGGMYVVRFKREGVSEPC